MATSRSQRIFIWIIAVTMLVGSLGASFLMILANDNNAKDLKAQQEAYEQLQKKQKAEQERMSKPAEALPGYKATPFNVQDVTKLKGKDLKKGSGKVVKKDSTVEVNYFGWTSDGKIFDSSNRGGAVKPVELPLDGVIEGWTKGLEGANEGTVRQLLIPAELAYGKEGTNGIKPNSPLAFIIEVVKVK